MLQYISRHNVLENYSHFEVTVFSGACSFAPHVAIIEAGLEAELILAQLGSMTKEFEALNLKLKLKVPVLAMDDEIIMRRRQF
jgi:hypothetical protein